MKTFILIILMWGIMVSATTKQLTFEMISGFSKEDSSLIYDEPDFITHFEDDTYALISIKGYFSNFKNEDLFHDGRSRKLFLVERKSKNVIDSYPYALGNLNSSIEKQGYIILTDQISRGGSGGSECFGYLKVFTIQKGKINVLFDEQVAYQDDGAIGSTKFNKKAMIALENNSLVLYISKKANSCATVPFGKIGSDLYGMFSFVMGECLKSYTSRLYYRLDEVESGDNSRTIKTLNDHFSRYYK